MKVPFMDLHRQYVALKPELDRAIQSVIETSEFIGGQEKARFERAFAEACRVNHCIGVGNGTDAIFLALKALGIGPRDEVVVPAMSFIASAEAISAAGATPVFVDIDPKTYLMDLQKTRDLLSRRAHTRGGRIRALMPVHLYGRINPMTEIMALAREYDLFVVEDVAQAHLAEWGGRRAGSFGQISTFSFYPGKTLGAFGDAGAIVTDDAVLADRSRKLANHGRVQKYDHDIEGFNSRLDGLQAAVLNVKLPHLPAWSEARRTLARRYDAKLSGLRDRCRLPEIPNGNEHVFHLYVIRVPDRARVQAELAEKGVQTAVHYPIALPNLKAYERFGHGPADFPVATQCQNEVLSLPFFPEMTNEEQDYVAEALGAVLQVREGLSL